MTQAQRERNNLAAEYYERQTGYQAALEKLRQQTQATVRLRLAAQDSRAERDLAEHRAAQAVLAVMSDQVKDLKRERDRIWRELRK